MAAKKNTDAAGRRKSTKGEAPLAHYAEKDITATTERFCAWIEEQTGYAPDPKAVQLGATLRAPFQSAPESQAYRAERKAELEAEAKARAERKAARAAKKAEPKKAKAEPKAPAVKKAPAKKAAAPAKKAGPTRRRPASKTAATPEF